MQQLLSLFNLSPNEKTLYQTLFYGGTMGASQLAKQANISRPSAYDLLESLIAIGLVTETTQASIKMFTVQPLEKIQLLLEEKQNKIRRAGRELNSLQQIYKEKIKSQKPRLQLFEGRPALQQMMKDMLLYRDMPVLAFWPIKNVLKLLTPQFIQQFHLERIQRNIQLKVIWPKNHWEIIKKYRWLKPNTDQKRAARLAPNDISFSLGYVIYGHTVRFLSSSKENYGFLVDSQELTDMMTSQWQTIWKISKPLESN